jgi:hypothetical protein
MAVITGVKGSIAFSSWDAGDTAIPTANVFAWTLREEQTLRDISQYGVKYSTWVPDQYTWSIELQGYLDDANTKPGMVNFVSATVSLKPNSDEAARSFSGNFFVEKLNFLVSVEGLNSFDAVLRGTGTLTLGGWGA